VLSEEALILLAAFAAVALVVLGVLELVWPSKPRHPVRRRPPVPLRPAPPPRPAAPELPGAPLAAGAAQSPFAQPPRAAARPVASPRAPVAPPPAPPTPRVEAPPARAASATPFTPPLPAPPRSRRSKVSPHARPHAGRRLERAAASPPPAPSELPVEPARGASPAPAPRDTVAPRELEARREPAASPGPAVPSGPAAPAPAAPTASAPPPPPATAPEPAQAPAGAPDASPPAPAFDPLLVETCFSLYQEGHYDELFTLADDVMRRLRSARLSGEGSRSAAALWSVVGLAKQALGDDEGARFALEAALEIAPADERDTYRQHVAALALSTAQSWLARAHSHETDDRVGAIRAGLAWIDRGLAAVAWDSRLRDLRQTACGTLWPACEQAALTLLQRQEFGAARRLLRQTLDDPECPPAHAEIFREMLTGTFGSEIGQLTAQAIRSMQEARESEALAALRRAEELLDTVPAEALPPKRREEVDQRLWWGYTKLGMRRVESGEYEDALDPLIHALRYGEIGPDRQAETRSALARALEGVADVRALAIRQLADGGQGDEAVLRAEQLRELVRSCGALGLTEEELSAPRAKAERLCAELGIS